MNSSEGNLYPICLVSSYSQVLLPHTFLIIRKQISAPLGWPSTLDGYRLATAESAIKTCEKRVGFLAENGDHNLCFFKISVKYIWYWCHWRKMVLDLMRKLVENAKKQFLVMVRKSQRNGRQKRSIWRTPGKLRL